MPGRGRASAGTIGVAVFIEFESFSSFCWPTILAVGIAHELSGALAGRPEKWMKGS
jgi:hypothetical protein